MNQPGNHHSIFIHSQPMDTSVLWSRTVQNKSTCAPQVCTHLHPSSHLRWRMKTPASFIFTFHMQIASQQLVGTDLFKLKWAYTATDVGLRCCLLLCCYRTETAPSNHKLFLMPLNKEHYMMVSHDTQLQIEKDNTILEPTKNNRRTVPTNNCQHWNMDHHSKCFWNLLDK